MMSRLKKIKLIYVAYIAALLLISDFFIGEINDTKIYRQSMQSFQSQVSQLDISSKQFIATINDNYKDFYLKDGYGFKSNNLGIPDALDNIDYKKSILFLGGSTTENNEVSSKKRFTNIVKAKLNKTKDKIGVMNLGVRGHSTQDSLNIYLNHNNEAIDDAKIVVLMHNINDRLYLAIKGNYRGNLPEFRPNSLQEILSKIKNLISSIYNFIRVNSNIIFLADKIFEKSKNTNEINEENIDKYYQFTPKDYAKFKENLELFISIAHIKKQIPILMTQPLGYNSPSQKKFNGTIKEVAKNYEVKLIDLEKEINSKEIDDYFLSDGIHFNDYGSEKAGEIIYKNIRQHFNKKLTTNCKKSNLISKYFDSNILKGRYPSLNYGQKKLLFQTNSQNKNSISILDLESSIVNKLLEIDKSEHYEHPAWINNNEILYGVRESGKNNIFKYNLSSKKIKKLNNGLYGAIAHVNKSSILFAGYKSPSQPINIYKLDLLSNKTIQITSDQNEKWRPIVSKKNVYFIKKINGKFDLIKYDTLNNKEEIFIAEKDDIWDPAISLDGKLLAYATRNNKKFLIKILNIENKKIIKTIESADNNWDPYFINDSMILFAAEDINGKSNIKFKCF